MTIAAIRHNNPGNVSLPILGWHGPGKAVGIMNQPGHAKFPDMRVGFAAFQQRVYTYIAAPKWRLDTIRRMHRAYTPETSWPSGVSRKSGIGLDDALDVGDADQMQRLMAGILYQETGMSPTKLGISPCDFARGLDPLFPEYVSR